MQLGSGRTDGGVVVIGVVVVVIVVELDVVTGIVVTISRTQLQIGKLNYYW